MIKDDGVNVEVEKDRSQKGYLNLLCNPSIVEGDGAVFSPIGFGSVTIRRVCRATLQAEAYSLSGGIERGFKLRAVMPTPKVSSICATGRDPLAMLCATSG